MPPAGHRQEQQEAAPPLLGAPDATGGGRRRPAMASRHVVDASTLLGRHLMGYQGWFGCPGDGSALDRWWHWCDGSSPRSELTPRSATFDAWPDTTELGPTELFETSLGGSVGVGQVFSSYRAETVERHARWMRDHGCDGVLLQRFCCELGSPPHREFRDQVARNVCAGAEAHGRVFAIMYDISGWAGGSPQQLVAEIQADWVHLVDTLELTRSGRYQRHAGRPLVGLWGFGFTDRPCADPHAAAGLVDWFHGGGGGGGGGGGSGDGGDGGGDHHRRRYEATVLGGVPTCWRERRRDARPERGWASYYGALDVLSPWSVGRFRDAHSAARFYESLVRADLALMRSAAWPGRTRSGDHRQLYMPVLWPGFSWANLQSAGATDGEARRQLNQIPRRGGRFYWEQVQLALR
jgi:hypothetical protein